MTTSADRSAGLDLLRLLAVVVIVVAHVVPSRVVGVLAYTWHVPVFFVLTGYLWTSGRSAGSELSRRLRTLGVPYACWLVVLLAMLVLQQRRLPREQVRDALLGGSYATRPFTAFWFVTALLLAVVVWRALERAPRGVATAVALGGATLATAAGPELSRVPLAAGSALSALVLVLAGQRLRAVAARVPTAVAGLAVAGGLLSALSGLSEPVNLKVVDVGTPVLSLVVAAVVSGGLVVLAERLPVGTGARAVAAATTPALLVVVLAHAAVLQLLMDGPVARRGVPAGLVTVTIAAVVVPLALGVLLARTPLAPVTNGRRARQGSNLRPSA